MPKCPICYDYPFEGERCPICGFTPNPQEAVWWKVVAYHPLTGRRLEPRPFSKREYARIHVERLKALGYEARYFPAPYGRDPNQLEEKPLTWEVVTAWFEAEGTFETEIRPKELITRISIAQKDRKLSGYKLVENIRNFIDTHLGTTGHIYEYPDMPPQAIWTAHLDCYKIAAEMLPWQHHPAKIEQTIKMLKAIEEWKRQVIRKMEQELPKLKGRPLGIAKARLEKARKDLEEIQKIKKEHPYLLTLF